MEYSYCQNCGKMTGHKRNVGMGTFLGAVVTGGASLAAVPFYPKRCIVCGMEKEEVPNSTLKKCPQCAEEVKAEAKICRFCRYNFPEQPSEPADHKASLREQFETLRLEFNALAEKIYSTKSKEEKARIRAERDRIEKEMNRLKLQLNEY